jgi:hypothetical protein
MTLLGMSFLPIELMLFYEEKYSMRGQNRTAQTDTEVLSGIPLSIPINLYNTMTYQKTRRKNPEGAFAFYGRPVETVYQPFEDRRQG